MDSVSAIGRGLDERRRALFEKLLKEESVEGDLSSTISRRRMHTGVALSFAQERLWFLGELDPGSVVYNIPMGLRLDGALDRVVLQRSLEEIVQRHEALRTRFETVAGRPVQVIEQFCSLEMPFVDLSELPEVEQNAEASRLCREEAQRAFDLGQDLLLRARLFRLEPERHVLFLNVHHIAADGWSVGVLLRELGSLYEALCKGQGSPLQDLPIQYADFAVWQRDWLQGGVLEKQLGYWKTQLAGAPALLELPTDRPRPARQSHRGATETVVFPSSLLKAVKALSQQEGASLFMTLLAAFQTLLSRYTGQEDLVVGSPIAGRNRIELEGLIGFFINTLVLRGDLSGKPTFRELLRRMKEVTLGAYGHQDLPFEKLVEELKPERNLSYSTLFQVMFALDNTSAMPTQLGGLGLNLEEISSATSKFDLSMSMSEGADGLTTEVEYCTDLFDAGTIRRMLGHYQVLLEGIIANPDVHIGELPLLTEAERHQLLVEWNETQVDYPTDRCLHEFFEDQVERTPNAIAVAFEDQYLTYRDLNSRSNQLANYLRKMGVGPDVLVGICAERSLHMIVGMLGVLKAGAAYVPIDPSYPAERVAFMLIDAKASVVLTQQNLVQTLPVLKATKVLCLDNPGWETSTENTDNPKRIAAAENLAYIIYTSGSTGKPKGVMIPHRAIVNQMRWMQSAFPLDETDRVLQKTSISFDTSVSEFYAPLLVGARLVVARPDGHRDPAYLAETIIQKGVTVVEFVPSMLRDLLKTPQFRECISLRCVFCGGEVLTSDVSRRFFEILNADLHNLYGPTEVTINSIFYSLPRDQVAGTVPIGRPVANTQAYVLDGCRQPVPIDVPGELYLGGVQVGRGYLNQPKLTAEKFIQSPFSASPEDRLYRTGDVVRYSSDGNIEFLGRIDHQVKIRGYRIELGEIESVLKLHSAAREAVVVARENVPGDQRLVAYVVPASAAAQASELREFLKARLPDYMLPSAFVFIDAFPLTPSGKLDRKALPPPERHSSELEASYVAPRTPTEELLGGIWCEVLNLKQVGIHDNFFELGGHSLLAIQVISRVRDVFQVETPVRLFFEQPSISNLAERINEELGGDALRMASPIVPAHRAQYLPLSFAQKRLWLLDQLEPTSSAYNVPLSLRLSGELNVAALEQSLGEIVRRHEVLRTTFNLNNDEPVQVVREYHKFSLPVVDLRMMSNVEREDHARQLMNEEALLPFDLRTGPLLRGLLLQIASEEFALIITVHHIVFDGWSTDIFYHELSALYEAFSKGNPSPLPEMSLQYADFAAWQWAWLSGEALDRQSAYWKQQLSGSLPVLELPSDYPRPAIQRYRGAERSIVLSESIADSLRTLSREEQATLFMTLLAGLAMLLHRHTAQEDIIIGSPVAGRNRGELERLIGFFVNTLVLRIDLSGDPTFRELLRRTRKVAFDAYAHQDLPFEKLVEELQLERRLDRNPLVQVMLNFFNWSPSIVELQGLKTRFLELDSVQSKFDLTLYVMPDGKGIRVDLVYNVDLFAKERMEDLLNQFGQLLEQLAAHPDECISRFNLVTPAAARKLPDPTAPLGSEWITSVHAQFSTQAKRVPHRIAIEDPMDRWSYQELETRSNQLAHYLCARGVEPRDIVAIYGHRSASLIWALLGVLKAGAAFLILDPTYPAARLLEFLRAAKPKACLKIKAAGELPEVIAEFVDGGRCQIELPSRTEAASNKFLCEYPTTVPGRSVGPEDPAYIVFTSGSTASPKGIVGTHQPLSHFLRWHSEQFDFKKSDRFSMLSGLSHDPLLRDIFTPLWLGATLCIPDAANYFDPNQLLRWMKTENISTVHWTPSMCQILISSSSDEFLPKLRYAFFGGDILSRKLVAELQRVAPSVTAVNVYGATETPQVMGYYVCPRGVWITDKEESSDTDRPGMVPLGKGIQDVQLLVLNSAGRLAGIGERGQICVRTVYLAKGYLDDDVLTHERFIVNPLTNKADDICYNTGDSASYLPDGNVSFLGRSDAQVKIRGYRVELGEVESTLLSHPLVRQATVVAGKGQEGGQYLIGYVVCVEQNTVAISNLREFLGRTLPNYMIPSTFVFVEAIPLTPNGKVDHQSLPLPEQSEGDVMRGFAPPRTSLEQALAAIWCQVLKLPKVGISDNFFELGGHSLLAVHLQAQIRRDIMIEVPLAVIYQRPTIEGLALYILQQKAEAIDGRQIERLFAELEVLSEDDLKRDLRTVEVTTSRSSVVEAVRENPIPAAKFHCPSARSKFFGRRECNLLILVKDHFEMASFENVALVVRELDPTINAVVARDSASARINLPDRPTLTFSPAMIKHCPPHPGRVFCGYPLSKSEEYMALERVGIAVPKWTLLTEDEVPNLSNFDEYVVQKPNYGGRGLEVQIANKSEVRWKKITTDAQGESPSMIIQQFIYTGALAESYRVNTLFGRVLYSIKTRASASSPELKGIEDLKSMLTRDGDFSIASVQQESSVELNFDEEIIRFGELAHGAFPEIPLLGVDIVREIPSGRLFVLEVNAIGYVWNFQSTWPANLPSIEEQFDGVRKAAYVLAERTQEYAL